MFPPAERDPTIIIPNNMTNEKHQGRYMLIHMGENVYRFVRMSQALKYANDHCHGRYEFYIIIDAEENKVVSKWSY